VRQEFDYELEVEGELPLALQGTLYRNGPVRTLLLFILVCAGQT
jgi:carotenoid cleavage dioxygenase-like enzyme